LRTIALFLLFFYLFFFIFGQKFGIVRNFLTIKSSSSPSPNPIPNKSDPEVRSRSPNPTPTWKLLVRKPNNCSQFGQDAAVTADPAQHRLLLAGRTGPKTEQLFGFLTREGRESCISLEKLGGKPNNCDIPIPVTAATEQKKPQRRAASGVNTEQMLPVMRESSPFSAFLGFDQLVYRHLSKPKINDLRSVRNPCSLA
jgi:hypothetical protein